MPKSPILGGFSESRARGASNNEAYNLNVEVVESKDGKVPGFLFGSSGLDLVGTIGDGPVRGVATLQDTLYIVSGSEVYSLTPNGTSTLLGDIGDQATPVSMFANNRQLMIVDGVGGWLVPGGYPLTGGTIAAATSTTEPAGGLYAINDTVTLLASSGNQTSYPIIQITGIANNPVTSFRVINAGTTYNTASAVATTAIEPQPGVGTGLTINITGASGPITSTTLASGGTGYAVGDTGVILTGSRDAVYRVKTVSGGVVLTYILLNPGSSYAVVAAAATQKFPSDLPNNLGTGLTVNITASAGPITASSVANGGRNYVIGAAGFISGGTGDATYAVDSVGANGTVTSFTIIQGGAIDTPALSFTQKSTSGSGSGLTLTSPTYGAFVGLVPVDLPFDAPMVGGESDGYGLLVFQGSQVLAASDEEDLSTWGPLSYGLANQSPDNCNSLHVIHNEVYVLKSDNTEVWVDQALPNFPFAPLTGVHMETGCMAPFSVAVADQELIWLSRNNHGQGVFVKAAAYQVTPIGTQALTNELQTYSNLGDCIAYVRQEGGHVYYVATFPEANKTWCYDKTASALVGYPIWTRLAAFDNGAFNRHWGNCFTPWRGSVTLVQDTVSYQAESVTMTAPVRIRTASGLTGLPLSFAALMFSVWLAIPDSAGSVVYFSNQNDDTLVAVNAGLFIKVQNDANGSPQITVKAYDVSNTIIVSATYNFASWVSWVNIQVSIDTATQQIQVYANTNTSNALVETELTAAALTWSSSHPIAASATQPWHVAVST